MCFWQLFFQSKNYQHFEFLMDQILGQRLIIFEKLRYRSQLLLKVRVVGVASSLIKCRLDQLNNKHTNIEADSEIQFFESHYQMNCVIKVWSFLTNPLQNDCPLEFLRNSKETIFYLANIFKLYGYQTFGLMKTHNMSKFNLWKSLVYD